MKYVVLICASLCLVACGVQDEHYYRTHPQALQQALKFCPGVQPSGLSCAAPMPIAASVNELAYQLQYSPQHFGQQIIALQEKLAQQEAVFAKDSNQAELKLAIEKNKQNLAERMAIVRWLESPES